MNDEIENILVKTPNWVGDNIFTLPAVRELRMKYPRAHLTVLVKSGLEPLWEIVPEVDEVVSYDFSGGGGKLRRKWELIKRLRKGKYHLAVVFPRSFESALWMRLAGIERRWGYQAEGRSWLLTRATRSPRGYRRTHRIDYYYHLLDNAESDLAAPPPELELAPELLSRAREFIRRETGRKGLEPLVGLHPRASHGPAKCWPPEYYARLARLLVKEKEATVLVFGQEHEREMVQSIVRSGSPRAFNLAGKTDLKQLAALIKLCRVLVANDTGPLHLAAALGVPVVGIFGSSDPEATGPRGRFARVIYKNLPCGPCLKRFCPTDFLCMTSITPEEVIRTIEELWNVKNNS